MKTTLLITLSALIFLVRYALTILLFSQMNVAGHILGVISAISLCTTGLAWHRGTPDLTWRGIGVGAAHLAVLTLQPAAESSLAWQVLFWSIVAAQCWAKIALGARCTVTGPVYVSLERNGPYKIVRHPMTVCEILFAISLVIQNPTAWNLVSLSLVILTKVYILHSEETFLSSKDDYKQYALEVPWRLVPRVW